MRIKCLKCGCEVFQTGINMCKTANVDFEDEQMKFVAIDNAQLQSMLRCSQCKTQYNIDDPTVKHSLTHPLIKCEKCGKEFTEGELDENHVCAICRVKEMDSSFANLETADPFTLMRMLAQVRIDNLNLTKTNEQIQKRLEKAEDIEIASEKEAVEEKPKRKPRKKKTKDTEIESTETETIDLDAEESNNDSDIEISEDIAPEIPTEVTAMSNEMNEGVS